jgi:hypothetical protein
MVYKSYRSQTQTFSGFLSSRNTFSYFLISYGAFLRSAWTRKRKEALLRKAPYEMRKYENVFRELRKPLKVSSRNTFSYFLISYGAFLRSASFLFLVQPLTLLELLRKAPYEMRKYENVFRELRKPLKVCV